MRGPTFFDSYFEWTPLPKTESSKSITQFVISYRFSCRNSCHPIIYDGSREIAVECQTKLWTDLFIVIVKLEHKNDQFPLLLCPFPNDTIFRFAHLSANDIQDQWMYSNGNGETKHVWCQCHHFASLLSM